MGEHNGLLLVRAVLVGDHGGENRSGSGKGYISEGYDTERV